MRTRRTVLLFILSLCALGLTAAAPAAAAPAWNLDVHHTPTNFPPGGEAEYWFDMNNVGSSPTSGTTTLALQLPSGVTRDRVIENVDEAGSLGNITWSCPGAQGDSTVVCTTSGSVARHTIYSGLRVKVDIAPAATGEPVAMATLEGGGAPAAVSAEEPTPISPEAAGFGFPIPSFKPGFFAADGLMPTREAGEHPAFATFPFDFNLVDKPTSGWPLQSNNAEFVRDLHVDTPPGFIGNPTAVGECSQAEFITDACPLNSQVGRIDLRTYPILSSEKQVFTRFTVAVYNLAHPRGAASELGFAFGGDTVHIRVSLNPANHYAITSEVPSIDESTPVFDQRLVLWGVPADSSHDSERCIGFQGLGNGHTEKECSTDAPRLPFLTVPSQCEEDNTYRLHHYDSWQETGVFGPEIDYTLPQKMTNCDKPRFEPEVEIEPTGKQANTPTGLDVHVKLAQNENRNALATPPVKRFTVRLPEGMSFSPSFADGLQACTLAQMQLGTNNPIECPDASRIGEVTLDTPLLPQAAEGSMYLAAQGDNPFGSTFALLLVLHDTEERGILIKIPGRIDVDEETGQITTVFNDTPQFPFDDLTLKFRSGPRAPLVSPPSCGTQTIGVEVASYAQPQKPVDASNTYDVAEGPNGTPCPSDPGHRPFHPAFTGGTLNPVAGHYSTFLFRMHREDDEQELSQVTSILPPGLVAKIAGVSLCPDQAIASISTELGTGRQEQEHPACPASSQLGTISAGLGAGPGPNYFPGKAYLAGPYKGAPLSLAIVAPALAGPYDLGNVVVRTALFVDPETSQVKAVSDPFPTILHGVILRVRDVRLRLDKPETTINPTSCDPMSLKGLISGVGASLLTTADDFPYEAAAPFQVGSCSDLPFQPKLSFRLFGATHRGSHPKLHAVLTMPPGQTNIAFASVALPHSEFLDQGHIGTVCTRVQFKAEACPAASIYGTATAKTPLLSETLQGNIYLRSSSHELPDIVVAFRGGRINADVVGRVDSIHGGIRNTFEAVPDVPVSEATFDFFGGAKGLLVNSRNICKGIPKVTAKLIAHDEDLLTLRPSLKSACKAKAQGRRKRQR